MSVLYIQSGKEYTEYIVLDDDQPLCYMKESVSRDGIDYEDIFLGKIDRIQKGMDVAYVQFEKGMNAYLPFSECVKPPVSGDKVLVQIKRMTTGMKLPYVTEDISVAGKYAILLPFKDKIAISQRITDTDEKTRLKDLALRIKPAGMGLIIRSEAVSADEATIQTEINALLGLFEQIKQGITTVTPPAKVYSHPSVIDRLLRDRKDIDAIYTDGMPPDTAVNCYRVSEPFLLKNARQKVEKNLQHNVWMKSGAYYTCDICEALTVYDINSGKYQPSVHSDKEENILRLNEEAAKAVAANIQLRRLGGIILIDFLDMKNDEEREYIVKTLEAAFRNDPVKTVIHGFTRLGLLEMTRKRTEASLTIKEVTS